MRYSILLALLLAVAGLLVPLTGRAAETYSPEALDIANSLNCPVCQGLSVRDSNSALAQQMRDQIQQMLDQGATRQEILDYFADSGRYGIGVLRDPPKSGFVLTLWWGPVIGLAAGVLILGTFLLQRQRRQAQQATATELADSPSASDDPDLQTYEERLLREIDGMDVRTS